MKIAICLAVHNRIDDLLAHLDVLKYYPFEHEVIIPYTKHDISDYYLERFNEHHALPVDGVRFGIGPLMSCCAAVRKAAELGIEKIVYFNSDDITFNGDFVLENFQADALCTGYNWLGKDRLDEFAMNHLYLDVASFAKTVDWAEDYFRDSGNKPLCEYKLPHWILKSIGDWSNFRRLSERERRLGVGHDRNALVYLYRHIIRTDIPEDAFLGYEENNRWENTAWSMLGYHNNRTRYWAWLRMRSDVPYAASLEKEEQFARWIEAAKNGLEWGLPNSDDHIENKRKVEKRAKKLCRIRLR